MFRSFIYLDTEKLDEYMRLLNRANPAKMKEISQKRGAEISAGTKEFIAKGSFETEYSGEFVDDKGYDYDLFERGLQGLSGENYFDFVSNDGYDITTVPPMEIVRLRGSFDVPEEFDFVDMIDRFKPLIMDRLQTNSHGERIALESLFGNASAEIPIIIDYDDIVVSGKLKQKYLKEPYAQLEDYMDQDVFVLCKVIGTVNKEKVEIFDPLKDFMKLSRSIRKKANTSSMGLEKIEIDGPVLKVEVIAIYK